MGGYYLDSLHNTSDPNSVSQCVAEYVLKGLEIMMHTHGREVKGIDFIIESNTPRQDSPLGNRNCASDGFSACGPFVWLMAKEYSLYIVECLESNIVRDAIDLHLPAGFGYRLQWNSANTRRAVYNLVLRELRTRSWLSGTD